LKKTIAVNTDDPRHRSANLIITGKVKAFAKVAPRYARLNGAVGTPVNAVVRITPTADYPFKITEVKVRSGRYITYDLAQPSAETKGAYLLTVTNTKKKAGRYADTITLKTDSKVRSELKVGVYGYLSDPSKKAAQKRGSAKTGS
jgi:hypothetical protein